MNVHTLVFPSVHIASTTRFKELFRGAASVDRRLARPCRRVDRLSLASSARLPLDIVEYPRKSSVASSSHCSLRGKGCCCCCCCCCCYGRLRSRRRLRISSFVFAFVSSPSRRVHQVAMEISCVGRIIRYLAALRGGRRGYPYVCPDLDVNVYVLADAAVVRLRFRFRVRLRPLETYLWHEQRQAFY
jgi:hypothetical protein